MDRLLEKIMILYVNAKLKNEWEENKIMELSNAGKYRFTTVLSNLFEIKEVLMMII